MPHSSLRLSNPTRFDISLESQHLCHIQAVSTFNCSSLAYNIISIHLLSLPQQLSKYGQWRGMCTRLAKKR